MFVKVFDHECFLFRTFVFVLKKTFLNLLREYALRILDWYFLTVWGF